MYELPTNSDYTQTKIIFILQDKYNIKKNGKWRQKNHSEKKYQFKNLKAHFTLIIIIYNVNLC